MAGLTVGELSVRLSLDKKGLDSSLSSMEKSVDNAGSKISSGFAAKMAIVGTAAVKAFDVATDAIKNFVSTAVGSFADYEQLIGGVETLFKTSAGTVEQYANEAYKTAGLSANEYMETVTSFSASLLQGLGGDTAQTAEIANQAVVDMADNANKMGTDIARIQDAYQGFAKQNYTMLDNLKLGYGGTQAEMARLINDSGVLGDSITVTAETVNSVSFDKMIEAIHAVQTNLDITGTTSKEAASTISGSLSSMKSSWENLLAGLGKPIPLDDLFNTFLASVDTFAANILPALDNIMASMEYAFGDGGLFGALVEKAGAIIEESLPKILESLVYIAGGIAKELPSLIVSIVNALVQALPMVLGALTTVWPDVLSAVVEGVIQIAEVLTSPDNIQTIIQAAIELLMAIVNAIPQIIPPLVTALPQIIQNIIQALIVAIPQLIEGAIQLLHAIIDAIPIILPPLLQAIPDIINTITTFLLAPDTIELLFDAAIELLMAIVTAIPELLNALIPVLPDILNSIINFLLNPNTLMQLLNAAVELFTQLVLAVPKILGSLIKAFGTLVGNMWEGIKDMFGRFAGNFGEFISGIFKGAINGMISFIEGFLNTPIRLINGFIGVINGAFGWLGVHLGNIDLVSLPRLEYGGIIPGSSYSGDHNLVRANSGEMVITRQQQAALWDAIETGTFGSSSNEEVTNINNRPIEINNNNYFSNELDIDTFNNKMMREIRMVAA